MEISRARSTKDDFVLNFEGEKRAQNMDAIVVDGASLLAYFTAKQQTL
jgi:hypothetical protein